MNLTLSSVQNPYIKCYISQSVTSFGILSKPHSQKLFEVLGCYMNVL